MPLRGAVYLTNANGEAHPLSVQIANEKVIIEWIHVRFRVLCFYLVYRDRMRSPVYVHWQMRANGRDARGVRNQYKP